MKNRYKNIIIRYSVATAGLVLVAIGVALSIISDLGTSPISCLPYVLSLWGGLTVGEFTALMHLFFIILQIILLRRRFRMENLMQILAAVVFGGLTDLAIWGTSWIVAATYTGKASLMLLSIVITAAGISIEVRAHAWMLAGEMTVAAISDVTGYKFRNVKIIFDVVLVAISAITAYIIFRNPIGNGTEVVIREGTLASALLTGLFMKFIDPVTEKIFGGIIDRYQDR